MAGLDPEFTIKMMELRPRKLTLHLINIAEINAHKN